LLEFVVFTLVLSILVLVSLSWIEMRKGKSKKDAWKDGSPLLGVVMPKKDEKEK
jgi:hypothetical protein